MTSPLLASIGLTESEQTLIYFALKHYRATLNPVFALGASHINDLIIKLFGKDVP